MIDEKEGKESERRKAMLLSAPYGSPIAAMCLRCGKQIWSCAERRITPDPSPHTAPRDNHRASKVFESDDSIGRFQTLSGVLDLSLFSR